MVHLIPWQFYLLRPCTIFFIAIANLLYSHGKFTVCPVKILLYGPWQFLLNNTWYTFFVLYVGKFTFFFSMLENFIHIFAMVYRCNLPWLFLLVHWKKKNWTMEKFTSRTIAKKKICLSHAKFSKQSMEYYFSFSIMENLFLFKPWQIY